MESEIQKIISLLRQTFEKDAWHGPSVSEGLADISEEQALKRLPNTHSIIELVAHMTAWRDYVSKKLEGDAEYKVSEDMNFPQSKNWRQAIRKLEDSQETLLASLQKFPAEKLYTTIPGVGNATTYYTLLHGIIHHDLYHTGQIILIKKATRQQTF